MKKLLMLLGVVLHIACTILVFSENTSTLYILSENEFEASNITKYKYSLQKRKIECYSFDIITYIPISIAKENGHKQQLLLRFCESENFIGSDDIYLNNTLLQNYESIPDNTLIVPFNFYNSHATSNIIILCDKKLNITLDYYKIIHTSPSKMYGYANNTTFRKIHDIYKEESNDNYHNYCIESIVKYKNLFYLCFFWLDIKQGNQIVFWDDKISCLILLSYFFVGSFFQIRYLYKSLKSAIRKHNK